MTKKVRVEVTEEDIRRGKRESCRECPIALAMIRAFPKTTPEVGIHAVELWSEADINIIDLPKSAIAFVNDFDSARKVHPFSFTLEVPCPASK